MNCEEKMREKNEMGEEGCMCVVGEKKKKKGNMGGGEKIKEIKKKKEMGSREWGLRVWWEKRESENKRRKKN